MPSDTTLVSRFQAAVDAAKAGAKDIAQDIHPSTEPLRLLDVAVRHACKVKALRLWQAATDQAYPYFVEADAIRAVTIWAVAEKAQVLNDMAIFNQPHGLLQTALNEAIRRQTIITLGDIADAANMD